VLDIRRRTGYLFVVVMLAQLVLISAQVQTRTGATVMHTVVLTAFAGIQRATSTTVEGARSVWVRYVSLTDVEQQNEQLRRQLAELSVELQRQRARALKAGRLQLLLDLREAIAPRTLAAEVIAGDPTAFFRTVTINRGARDDVRPDMAVISAAGVVGRVFGEPAPHAARVQLLIDLNAGAGAAIERSRAGGVVVGDDGKTSLRMEYVSNLADVVPGDIVVTSGLDGIYPPGFVIGTVTAVTRGTGLYRDVRVRPSVDFSLVEEVLIVLEAPGAAPPQGGTP